MAGKEKTIYVCDNCGYESPKWLGRCPGCGAWNKMIETRVAPQEPAAKRPAAAGAVASAVSIQKITTDSEDRYLTGMHELDRVLGGGLVKGSVVLLSGDPGIGKSTILLQLCGRLETALPVLYVSGEESARQLKLRAQRLDVNRDNLYIMAERDVEGVCEYIRQEKPALVLIDSIQTMELSALHSSPGSVAQVRECTNLLLRTGKSLDIPIIIVGHVNKDGAIAGPKVMEHIVDTVLYFEGERNHAYRILRAIKNRYGSTNEIGVFEMSDHGLEEVENPSMRLLSERLHHVAGTSVACVLEGTRPILAEVQGLVSASSFGNPRRMATGFDYNRMNLLLAVLEKRVGYQFSNLDAYLNVVGGFRLDEPAADLPVALSLVSGLRDKAIPEDVVIFGEVGLSGEVRSVARAGARIMEADRMGFKRCVLPESCVKKMRDQPNAISLIGVRSVRQAIDLIL